ncbi:MAG: prolyl oligopeptidase family serine peptidase [bacterium]|nr:prolyl oligopeptidase family serine peptidase [bacterium]
MVRFFRNAGVRSSGKLYVMSLIILLQFSFMVFSAAAQEKKPLELQDFFQWKSINERVISDDGRWIAYYVKPQRGDGELVVINLNTDREYKIPRGNKAVFSKDAAWVGCILAAPEDEKGEKQKDYESRLALMNLDTGEKEEFSRIESFKFSDDSRFLAYKQIAPKNNGKSNGKAKKTGTDIFLKDLSTKEVVNLKEVKGFEFDENSRFMLYTVSSTDNKKDGIYRIDLQSREESGILTGHGKYESMVWDEDKSMLAFVSDRESEDMESPEWKIYVWNPNEENAELIFSKDGVENFPEGMTIAKSPRLNWAKDGRSMRFNIQIMKEDDGNDDEKEDLPGVDVWHWKDVDIQTQQAKRINQMKNESYTSVYHPDSRTFYQLSDKNLSNLRFNETNTRAIGTDVSKQEEEQPWFPFVWNTPKQDLFLIDPATGTKTLIEKSLESNARWSPGGKYLYWFLGKDWFAFSLATGQTINMTEDMDVEFRNITIDRPEVLRPWGVAGWSDNDEEFLVNDQFDIWSIPMNGGRPANITGGEGRRRNVTFRYLNLDRERTSITLDKPLLLTFFNNNTMATGYYRLRNGSKNPIKLVEMDKRIAGMRKAKDAEVYYFTIETFEECPDLHYSGPDFKDIRKLTDINPQQKDYAWGTCELIEWESTDGTPLKGILYYPYNYEPGKKYPLVLYIYEMMSQTFHSYFPPISNHRFNATEYTSNGYAVLKPDIVFKKGLPGPSSVNCVVPAVQKVVDMGVADPERVGLQGHSWGGYETAYIVTQTNIFAAACAGAPVSNMTSAYGGIRWGTGYPRTFQYETGQSRIGGDLWDKPELYIENSPLFFSDRVETPLLLMHGDEDGAVPWEQSIEYYLALRRLGKVSYFLQYNGEPHHLQKKKNQDDFTIKMWEFYEHYLRDKPMPEWMKNGVSILDKGKK